MPDQELSSLMAAVADLEAEVRRAADSAQLGAVGARLRDSVLRPLGQAESLRQAGSLGQAGPLADRLWELAQAATGLLVQSPDRPGLGEATAALQDMAIGLADPGSAADRLEALAALQSGLGPQIRVVQDGPYLVTNAGDLRDGLGQPLPMRPQLALCRCGGSQLKPFCDGAHARNGFSGAKDRDRVPDRRDSYTGQQVTIFDNRGTCQHSGLCTDRLTTVFRAGGDPFVAPSGGRMDEIIRAVRDCPSGALSYGVDEQEARGDVDYHDRRDPAIEVTRDGPYRVTGGITLSGADGEEPARNAGASREHYALCRCGHSQNKPFCSGMHWYVRFRDPVPDPDHEPTIFEWAGGLPALTRMTRVFYEKYVPQDPLLAPLFATMSADHPQRVAKWLGEVFGGPKAYSQEYGGYSADDLPARRQGPDRRAAGPLGRPAASVGARCRAAQRRRIPLCLRLLHRVGLAAGGRELPAGSQAARAHADAALGLAHRRRPARFPDIRAGSAGGRGRRPTCPPPTNRSASRGTSSRCSGQ